MSIEHTSVLNRVLERSAALAREQGYTRLLSDHFFLGILDRGNSHAAHLLGQILKTGEIAHIKTRIAEELQRMARRERTPKASASCVQPVDLDIALRMAAEQDTEASPLNTGHLLLAILRDRSALATRILAFYQLYPPVVKAVLGELPPDEDYYEDRGALKPAPDLPEPDSARPLTASPPAAHEPQISQFGTELTQLAARGKLDPVIGRDAEIERMVQILGRRKKNNPVLIGEPGVGKSALVEGLALRIVEGNVPEALRDKQIYALDVASLVSGTKYRGQFEERIGALVRELAANPRVILFIDEIHTIVGAGSTQGTLDTANILKPALAQGTLRCIGATTLDEYRRYIEPDGALERRFQRVLVEQSSPAQTLDILRRLKPHYEKHHRIVYTDGALEACVELAGRYMSDRFFPDKAIDVLDEAGSRAHLRYGDHSGEQEAVPSVGAGEIRAVVAAMTGIPLARISADEHARLQGLREHLAAVVVGQSEAVEKVTRTLQRSRVGLRDPDRPMGVFLFVGPTGVGKTHLAKQLADHFFESEEALVRIDMSEYAEKHTLSRLIGSPPGYVGYGEGGQLTERVRRRPYSIVLLDEVEKAHPEVFNLMLQLFDGGSLTDGAGRRVDFRHTIVIMTSNAGSREAAASRTAPGYGTRHTSQRAVQHEESRYRRSLERLFPPELLNRIDDIVLFRPLDEIHVRSIVELELSRLSRRLEKLGYRIRTSARARQWLSGAGYESRYGVRSLRRTLLNRIEEPLAEMIVAGRVRDGDTIHVGYRRNRIFLDVSRPA